MQPPVMRGLSNPALKLSADQKARIDKIMEGYIHEEHALNQRYSAPGAQRGAEAALASKQAWERMTAAMDQVLDVPQRQILKAEQAEQAEKAAQAAKAAMAARGVAPTREQPRSR
ncbi:MAG: hypothetical protein ABIQ86_11405 [Steroidobacteraceae bacterium]